MKQVVQRIVDQTSAVAAGLGVVLSPVPFADEALLLPVLGTMTIRIGRVHGLDWKEIPWKAITKTAFSGLLARATVNLGISYIPVVAAVANAASAAAMTGAFGAYADRACSDPAQAHTETLQEFKVDVRDLTERWRRLWPRRTGESSPPTETIRPSGESAMSSENEISTNHTPPAQPPPVAAEVRSDIERTLRTRHLGHGKILFAVEDGAKTLGAKAWVRLKRRPYTGVAVATAVGFTVATMTGVGELAVAALCGYAAYEVLRRGQPVGETVEEVVRDVCKLA